MINGFVVSFTAVCSRFLGQSTNEIVLRTVREERTIRPHVSKIFGHIIIREERYDEIIRLLQGKI